MQEIKTSNIHCDLKSYDKITKQINDKYKLFNRKYENIFIFFLFTKTDSCVQKCRIIINQCHYKNKKPNHLIEKVSYMDASKPDILSEQEIIDKINDDGNGFEYVATLCRLKFQELESKILIADRIARHKNFNPSRVSDIQIAASAVNSDKLKELEQLGLSQG